MTKSFPVVCIGGSAGGLDAYVKILKHLLSTRELLLSS